MDRTALQRAFPAGADLLVSSDRCVNTTFGGVDCARCTGVCPVDAMRVTDRSARIDQDACIGCGACLPTCPTEAITPRSRTPHLRLAFADLPPNEDVLISCPLRPTPSAQVTVVRHDRCLAALGAEQLVDLVAESGRSVWIDDFDCASCELAQLGRVIEEAVGNANLLLQGVGQNSTVRLATVHAPRSQPHGSSRVVDSRTGGMSRRGLFRRLIGEVSQRVSLDAGDDRLPRRRRRLLTTLDAMSPRAPSTTPDARAPGFGEVVVDADRCSACGLCASFCPTGALDFAVTTDVHGNPRFDLRAQAARCVDCGVCAAACPETAITVESSADLRSVLRRTSQTIASGSLAPCAVCGTAVAGPPGSRERCFGCRGGVVSPLRDEVGLMADLLSRLPAEG